MKLYLKHGKAAIALTAMVITLYFSAAFNVSKTKTPTEKAKSVRSAYQEVSILRLLESSLTLHYPCWQCSVDCLRAAGAAAITCPETFI